MSGHALVARLDSMGDMLICGPAIRAVAATADRVTVLAGPEGAAAARLLPGVDDVVVYDCPWIRPGKAPLDAAEFDGFVGDVRARGVDRALVLTSFHQSALPTALALRLAGVPWIAAVSEDYPGSLLDIRIADPADAPEPQRMLEIARSAGFSLPAGDDGRLEVHVAQRELPAALDRLRGRPYIAVHPGAAAPARMYPLPQMQSAVRLLLEQGERVVLTGSRVERSLTAQILEAVDLAAADRVVDLAGGLTMGGLATVLAAADVLVVGNTGPAHLAAAVRTPVVSLFSPVVPAVRWAPYSEERVVLGDQHAPCRGTRARDCPVPGHPCLNDVPPERVVAAVQELRRPARSEAVASTAGVRA